MSKQRKGQFLLLLTVVMMDLLTGMEFDIFVPSFPALQHHFQLTPFWVEALLSANFIGYCLSLFFVGGLSDRYGRKPIILLGLITFIVGSLFCLYAPSYYFFLAGRFLQGVGIAAPAILSFLIIADSYPLKEQQFLLAILNGTMNAAVGIAPVLGSYITLYFHWQGNFIALLLSALITTIMTIIFVPYLSLTQTKAAKALSLRGYLPILQSKPLMLLIINMLLIFSPYWIFVGISPLLFMKDLGVSLAHFGYYQGIFALVFGFGSIWYGFIIKNIDYDQKGMLDITAKILIASLIAIALVTIINSTSPLIITLAILLFVLGQIIPSAILYPLSLNFMPEAKARVSALIQAGRLVFTALALQIAGYFYDGTFRNIGIIITVFILLGVITLWWVMNNQALMNPSQSNADAV